MIKEYPIIPVPKPRMTMGDRRRKNKILRPPVKRYWDFCDQCKLEKVELPYFGAHVTFILPMPESWSEKKKKQFNGKPHQLKRKNDWDNLGKALSDAIYGEDSMIWDIHITKRWGKEGKIIIEY
jgi:Holliday junction resolvase RusA-like endonuclease